MLNDARAVTGTWTINFFSWEYPSFINKHQQILLQGCESICEKKVWNNLKCQKRYAFQCIQTALKLNVWKMGFVKSKKSLKTRLKSELSHPCYWGVIQYVSEMPASYERKKYFWGWKKSILAWKTSIFHFVSIEVYTIVINSKEKKVFWGILLKITSILQLEKSTKYCKRGTVGISDVWVLTDCPLKLRQHAEDCQKY